jgi:hypothetical protein
MNLRALGLALLLEAVGVSVFVILMTGLGFTYRFYELSLLELLEMVSILLIYFALLYVMFALRLYGRKKIQGEGR